MLRVGLKPIDWLKPAAVSFSGFHEKASLVKPRCRPSPGRLGDLWFHASAERTTRLPSALSMTSLLEVGAH
jgi:hypothetical protein